MQLNFFHPEFDFQPQLHCKNWAGRRVRKGLHGRRFCTERLSLQDSFSTEDALNSCLWSRDKTFEYGLVLDRYGTVNIGIASGLLSLSETRNEVSRYGSSMASKTGQLTAISNDPAAVQSIEGDSQSAILEKKQSIKGDSSILETRRDGIAKSIEGDSSIL